MEYKGAVYGRPFTASHWHNPTTILLPVQHLPNLRHLEVRGDILHINKFTNDTSTKGPVPAIETLTLDCDMASIKPWLRELVDRLHLQGNWETFESATIYGEDRAQVVLDRDEFERSLMSMST